MSADSDVIDDVLIRARRGGLSESDKRLLRDALSTSTDSRLLYQAGTVFDRDARVLPDDDQRIERMVRAVQKHQARAPSVWRARRAVPAMAVGILFAAGAVAAFELARPLLEPNRASPPPAPTSVSSSVRPRRSVRVSQPAEPPADTPDSAQSPPPPAPRPPVWSSRGAEVLTRAVQPAIRREPALTATQLFAKANRARVAGDSEAAMAGYQRLEAEYPGSPEALTAQLSLGMLYLQHDQPSRALAEFRAYRAHSSGPSAAEALWGEAGALRRLGRNAQERAALGELVARYPGSAYAVGARKRLAGPP
ncbi:MAG: tetratricopeptide repeat protein [Polyangiaceae bacterium]|nr:tetratricopeptide repeat protein [Polyangiaceae bacterium]